MLKTESSVSKNDLNRLSKQRHTLPYQDTFDNAGSSEDFNQPLASARYRNMQQQETSISSERNSNSPVTHRVFYKHTRNISHASMPDDIESRSNLPPM